jgi:hypothetical protein
MVANVVARMADFSTGMSQGSLARHSAIADDVALLFSRARNGLKPDGLIFVKENICKQVYGAVGGRGGKQDNECWSLLKPTTHWLL